METAQVIYLSDFDETVGIAVPLDHGYRFYASAREYRTPEGRSFKSVSEIAAAAHDLFDGAALRA